MSKEVYHIYQKRSSDFQQLGQQFTEKYKIISIVRISFFVLSFIGSIYFISEENVSFFLIILSIFLVGFPLLVNHHNQIAYLRNHQQFLKEINDQELLRLNYKLESLAPGDRYINTLHPYTGDLDVFGRSSIFQLLNRAITLSGQDLLANWLKKPAPKTGIRERQETIKELAPKLDWRQDFQALGKHFQKSGRENESSEQVNVLLDWVNNPIIFKNKTYLRIASVVMPVLMIYLLTQGLYSWLIPGMIINVSILASVHRSAKSTISKTSPSLNILKTYRSLIYKIESEEFHSQMLRNLKDSFAGNNYTASEELRRLIRVLDMLENRQNPLYMPFNLIFLLDIFLLLQAEGYKTKFGRHVNQWFDAINQFEGFNSLAGFAFSNPQYAFPKISDQKHLLNTTDMGHPLIHIKDRVTNNFHLEGKGQVAIITGSNMAGKSTFLRAVGVNMILAYMGAPVCASSFTISQMGVFTSMRTQDNLEENVSSFYAELRRLKQLLDLLSNDQPVLFLLDEVLKGTNSEDRHRGAVSLITQLSKLNASGLVSTHDLSLGKLSGVLPNISNYSFDSLIVEDEIKFDFQLREGICQSFNASKLMAKMGIEIST